MTTTSDNNSNNKTDIESNKNSNSANERPTGDSNLADESAGNSNDDIEIVNENDNSTSPPPTTTTKTTRIYAIIIFNVLLFLCFVYAVIVQYNDIDNYEWSLYYGLSAILSILSILHVKNIGPSMSFVKIDTIVYLISFGLGIWSCVYIILLPIQYKDARSEIHDDDVTYEKLLEEFWHELGGSCIVLFTSMYHSCIMKWYSNPANTTADNRREGK